MGCKQYARMLGLSRGYPYILYLSLSKWDAAPSPPFFHKAVFPSKSQVARWIRATPDLPLFEFFRGLPGRGPKFPGRSRQHLGPSRGPAFQI